MPICLKIIHHATALLLGAWMVFLLPLNGLGQSSDKLSINIISPAIHSEKISLTGKIIGNPFSDKNSDSDSSKAIAYKKENP